MNDLEKEKIKRFVNDPITSKAVYDFLLDSFLKERPGDVYLLAASRLSVNCLRQAWKELNNFNNKEEGGEGVNKNIGL